MMNLRSTSEICDRLARYEDALVQLGDEVLDAEGHLRVGPDVDRRRHRGQRLRGAINTLRWVLGGTEPNEAIERLERLEREQGR